MDNFVYIVLGVIVAAFLFLAAVAVSLLSVIRHGMGMIIALLENHTGHEVINKEGTFKGWKREEKQLQ